MTVTSSDGAWGDYDMRYLFKRGGSMIETLKYPALFKRVFVEAGALTLSPSGSRHWRRIMAPGCGGLCTGMGSFPVTDRHANPKYLQTSR